LKGLEDDKNVEEDWPLKDVVFVEDQKSLPIGNDYKKFISAHSL